MSVLPACHQPPGVQQLGSDFTQLATAKGIDQVGCFLELHIEQGARMQDQSLDTAVVTTIVGIKGYQVLLRGQTNHAGTTVMGRRRDALVGASRVVLALRDAALVSGEITANVGRIQVRPGGTNVVPGEAEFYIDIRTALPETYATLDHLVHSTVVDAASQEGLTFQLNPTYEHPPIPMDERLQQVLRDEMTARGLRWAPLSSGAGHDAQVLAQHVPTAMVFVPSHDGISHAPAEFTPPEQREPGVNVLTAVLRRLICEPEDTAERPDGSRAAAE
jgi:allantoate deiminase